MAFVGGIGVRFARWRSQLVSGLFPALLLFPVATVSDPGRSFQTAGNGGFASHGSVERGLLGGSGHTGASGEGGLPARAAGSDTGDAATALNRGLLGLSGYSSGGRAEGVSGRSDSPDTEAVLSRRDREALEPGELRHSLKERAVAAVNARLTRALDSRLQGMLLALGGEQRGLRLDSSLRWDVREGVQGGLDVFVPFFGDADSTWFLQPGFLLWPGLDGERRHDLNIGGGYRRRIGDWVAGGGVFYDHNVDSTLQRLGLSLDFRSGRGYGALNVYYSLTDWEDSGEAPGQREEHALGGLDLRLRYALTDALEVHGSLGMWEHYEEGSGEHKGLRPGGSFGVDYELLPGLSFGGSYEIADALGKDRYELGLRFVWPAQSRLRAEGGVADLYSVVKREKRILYARRDTGETDCGVELRAQVRGSPSGALSVGTQVEFSGRLVNAEGMSSSGLRCVGLGREFLVSNPVELRFRDRDGDGGYEGAELQGEVFVWRVPAPGSAGAEGFEYDVGSGSYTLRFRDPSGVIPESRIRFVGGDGTGDDTANNTYMVPVAAGVSVVPQALTVDEGGSGVYTVQLNSQPEAEVSITVLGATGDVTVSGSPLSFDASNWRTQQTVTVTAGGDADAEDERVELSHRASSGDSDYAGVEVAGVTVTVRDDETAGVTLSTGSLSLSEGGSGTYTVVLDSQPLEPVTVTPRSDNADVSFSPATLRFDVGAWSTAQTVRVTAEQDVDAADERAQLTHAVEGYGAVTSAGRVTVTVTDDETAGVTVTPRSVTVLEGDTAGSYYTVVLDSRPSAAVTVTPRSDNTDVVFTPATLRFDVGVWSMAQTVVVTARDDEDAIADSAMLTHGIAGGDYAGVSVPSVSVTVTEDDMAGVRLSLASLTVTEGRSEPYTVVLATRPSAAVTVTPSSDNADVRFSPATLRFATDTWDTAQTVVVSAEQDLDTNNDSATLSHSLTGGDYASVSVPAVEVTVTDDDVPGVTLSPQALTVPEGGRGSYTVVLNTQPSAAVTVTPSSDNADVSFSPATLSFGTSTGTGGWDTAQTVRVTAEQDGDAVDDSATLGHGITGGNYASVSVPAVRVTVTDDDTRGVRLSASALTVAEGGSGNYTVVLASEPSAPVTVTPSSDNADVSFSPATLSFGTGTGMGGWDTAQTVTVTAEEDLDSVNDSARLTHRISGGDYASVGVSAVRVTVTDNDTPGVTLNETTLTVDEGDSGGGTYTVVLATQPDADVTVTVSGFGSTDVRATPALLTFGTGTGPGGWSTAQTVTVTAVEDSDTDNDSVTLTHAVSGATGYGGGLSIASVAVTVTDTTPKLTLETNPTAVSEGTAISVTVTSDKDVTGTLSVRLTLADRGSSGFTAADIMGALTQPFTTASFSGGKTAAVTIPTVNDAIVEGAETYTITLVSGTGYALGSSVAVDGTLNDNDSAEVTLASGTIAVTEGQTLTVPVTLSAVADTVVNGRVTLSGVGGSTPTADFAAAMVDFSISAGNTSASAEFLAQTADTGDGDYNAARSYTATVTLRSPPAGVTVGSDNTDTVRVTDNTAPPTPGVTLNRSSLTVTEEDTTGVSYTVVLNTAPTGDVTVTVSSAAIGDVTATPSELTFGTDAGSGGWDTAQSVKVTAGDDSDADNDSVTLTHTASSSDNNYEGVSINSVMVTVTDNDTAGVRLSETTLTVTEEDTTGDSYTVVLATEPDADVTVTVGGFTGTDVTATPALLTFGTGTGGGGWATAQTVKVTAGDDANASNESVTLTHAASGATGYTVGLDIADVEVSVTDNDTAGVTLSPRALTVDEGSMGSYTVVLDTEPSADVTVTPSSNNADVTFSPSTLTFGTGTGGGGWDTEQSVTVTARLDADADNDSATLAHGITGGDYASVNVPDVSVTVTDTTPELTLETAPSAVAEGTAISVTVTSDKNVSGTLSVSLTLSDRGSSGFTADDIVGALTQTFTTASFSGGTTAAVTIATVDDAIVEGAETYRITLGSGTGYALGSSVAVDGTLNDNDSAEVTLASTTIAVTEGQSLTVPVTLSAAADTVVNGRVTLSDGTPTADFAAAAVNFSIAMGQTSGTASFAAQTPSAGDSTYNAPRSYTATVTLTSPPAGVTVGSDNTDTVTVTDNTAAPTPGVTVSPQALTVDEGSMGSYTVVLDTQPSADVTVTPSSNNADVTFSPSTLRFGTGTGGGGWATEQSVTVTAGSDADADNDSATLTHGITGGDYASVSVPDVSVTVTDTTPNDAGDGAVRGG